MHLIIDGYSSNHQILEDEQLIYKLLDDYPSRLGMTKIAPPRVYRYVGSKLEDWGISGFVLIAESHISIHTFVERCLVNVDIFSCKDFDVEQAIKDLRDKLQLTKLTSCLLHRGLYETADLKPAQLSPK